MVFVNIMGGLGNQMFQYCFYKSLQKKGKNAIPFIHPYKVHNGYELNRIFGIDIKKENPFFGRVLDIVFFKKLFFTFIKIFHLPLISEENINKRNWFPFKYYFSYWQSEKYFENIKDLVKTIFIFPKINDPRNIELEKKINETNSVSVHVRRGDYLKEPKLVGVSTLEYYKNSIEYIETVVERPYYFIFSDDIKWCKNNIPISENIIFIDWNKNENSYIDMQLMSLCKHNIIPNSTFSWWGAYLNKNENKIVLCPDKWSNNNDIMFENIIPSKWTKIKTV